MATKKPAAKKAATKKAITKKKAEPPASPVQWGDPMSYSDVESAKQDLRAPNKFICICCRQQAVNESEILHLNGCPSTQSYKAPDPEPVKPVPSVSKNVPLKPCGCPGDLAPAVHLATCKASAPKPTVNLSPIDLGKGKTLKFQRSTATANIRAIIVESDGSILFRGCLQPETVAGAAKTRMDVCAQLQASTKTYAGDEPDYDDDHDSDEEDDDDE